MISPEDKHIVAQTLYGECRGEPLEGQYAVAHVIFNRYIHAGAGSSRITLTDICKAPDQFSCWQPGTRNHNQMMAASCKELAVQCRIIENILISFLTI